jgi:hypothetical protein
VTGELVTAAMLNQDIRNNMNAVFRGFTVVKETTLTTTSTSYADATDLSWAVGANETWSFFGTLILAATAGVGAKLALSTPAGTTGWASYDVLNSGGNYQTGGSVIGGGADQGFAASVTTNAGGQSVPIQGVVSTVGTAGTVQLRFASQNGDSVSLFGVSDTLPSFLTAMEMPS